MNGKIPYNRKIVKPKTPNLNELHNIAKMNMMSKLNQNLQ